MKTATISEAKNKLSQLIDWVKAGETVIITDRDVPVARLESIAASDDPEGRVERLERQGIIKRGTGKLPDDFFDTLPKVKGKVDIAKAVREDRDESW